MKNLIKFIASVCYVGYSPIAPGTNGALVGLIFYLLTKQSHLLFLVAALFVVIIGFLASGKAEKIFGKKDAGQIVIDETAGMMLSLALIPYKVAFMAAAFIIFRIFDIAKPYPCKKAESIPGSAGVMLDDIVCALYTNLAVRALITFGILR